MSCALRSRPKIAFALFSCAQQHDDNLFTVQVSETRRAILVVDRGSRVAIKSCFDKGSSAPAVD